MRWYEQQQLIPGVAVASWQSLVNSPTTGVDEGKYAIPAPPAGGSDGPYFTKDSPVATFGATLRLRGSPAQLLGAGGPRGKLKEVRVSFSVFVFGDSSVHVFDLRNGNVVITDGTHPVTILAAGVIGGTLGDGEVVKVQTTPSVDASALDLSAVSWDLNIPLSDFGALDTAGFSVFNLVVRSGWTWIR